MENNGTLVTIGTSVYDRLFTFFEFVTTKKKLMKKGEFYERTGICDGYFRAGNVKGKQDVNVSTITSVFNVFPNASLDYFVFGKGDMFVKDEVAKQVVVVSDDPKSGRPYYDVDFRGGFELMENDTTSRPDYYINIEEYNKEGNVWCNISGHSMHPVIQSGDKICIRPINDITQIIYGEIYAIVTDEMRTVKYITRSDKEGCIRLVPENKEPHFGDYQDIPMESIRRVFKVVGSVHLF